MNIQQYYNMAMKVADEVLKDPIHGADEILRSRLGYQQGVKGFFKDPWNLILMTQPIAIAGRMAYKYFKNEEKKRLELEMMKRNIIAKQQAIIKQMEEEQDRNEQKNKHLQETIDFLEETLKRIEETEEQ